ncbi:hypothetical protein [uncultured Campylobacter sp.]|uniref:hypothetical protein n=1 Tax=uncultured Campylobacter sp. TaxID=218934 RepID=UPI00262E36F4|nr:hypothetical protein [uncultured Campylobacter sp.]
MLGTPPAADAALMKYMASACLVLFVERDFGAGRMAVCSTPMCRRTMKHSVPMYSLPTTQ